MPHFQAPINGGSQLNGHSEDEVYNEPTLENIRYPTTSLEFLQRLKPDTNRSSLKLNIIVVGAGLGGLATAIELARQGHSVKVLEQASSLGEVGAGIQVPSNSARILTQWGLEEFLGNRVVEPENIVFRRWESGKPIGFTKLIPDFRQKFQAPYWVVHRAHLHGALHALASTLGVVVRTNAHVQIYHESDAAVTLSNGTREEADLVIAADGIKSTARQIVCNQKDSGPRLTGFAAYRATVPAEKMQSDPDVSWLLEKPQLNTWIGHNRHVMSYTISAGESFNMVLSHVDHSDPSTWTEATAIQDMRKYFADWDPRLVKLVNMIESTRKWPLMMGQKLDQWVSKSGRLVILGDAAHAMLPYMSQGAAMAVEDAAALAEALRNLASMDDLTRRLKAFEKVRSSRTSMMQKASLVNGKLWHFADGPEQEARDLGMRQEVEGQPFDESPNQWSDPATQAWAYGYDAVASMKMELRDTSSALL